MLAYEDHANDAWIVWWAETTVPGPPDEMLRLFLKFMPHWKPKVGWARALKGRGLTFYSTDRLLALSQTK